VANFNLADYETVDSRIHKFYDEHPEGRIVTDILPPEGAVGATRWIVKAAVYRGSGYESPDGTGYAFEIDGINGMANKTSALENCETSAIGRALANIGYSGAKRPSQEEMRKTVAPTAEDTRAHDALVSEWIAEFEKAETIKALEEAWNRAGDAGVNGDQRVIAAGNARKKALT
jgi:hypothetical protein